MVNLLLLLPILKLGLAYQLALKALPLDKEPPVSPKDLCVLSFNSTLSLGYLRLRQIERRSDGR